MDHRNCGSCNLLFLPGHILEHIGRRAFIRAYLVERPDIHRAQSVYGFDCYVRKVNTEARNDLVVLPPVDGQAGLVRSRAAYSNTVDPKVFATRVDGLKKGLS